MTEPPQPPPPEDGSSLVPAILAAYAAYLTWRGANDALPTSWLDTAAKLGLRALIAVQLSRIAIRALTRQRVAAGRAGDEFLQWTQGAADAGVEAGVRVLAEALIWTDQHSEGDPVTKDTNDTGQRGTVPTAAAPPDLVAQMVAAVTSNTAQWAVGMLAGWRKVRWVSQRDSRVRETHVVLDGQTIPLGSVFTSPSGARLRYPHDPLAPMSEVANCFVAETEVSAADVTAIVRAPYSGWLVTIHTRAGGVLTGTPNHPMLTEDGWVGLGQLKPGDNLVRAGGTETVGAKSVVQPDVDRGPSTLGEIFSALNDGGSCVRMDRRAVDFYGDIPDGDVDVIPTDRVLRFGIDYTAGSEEGCQLGFIGAGPPIDNATYRKSAAGSLVVGRHPSPDRGVGGGGQLAARIGRHPLHPSEHRPGAVSGDYSGGEQASPDDIPRDAETLGQALFRLAERVSLDEVTYVERNVVVSRHVFTLSTVSGLYLADAMVTHNCRCGLRLVRR